MVSLTSLFSPRRRSADIQSLMGRNHDIGNSATGRQNDEYSPYDVQQESSHMTNKELDGLKRLAQKKIKKKKVTIEEKFFRAGFFTVEEKDKFAKQQKLFPIIGAVIGGAFGFLGGADFALLGLVFGVLVGYQLPTSMLDRKIKQRAEDIMFYLPLVIEQIIIGVSSSLDVGPCIQKVISMADERDTHNPVTELLRHAQLYAKSGVSFEEAMTEVGTMAGHTELKHAFMSLAQVVKHGGEITKQLQELADAVSSQRETTIEGKIKRLELEATGPVGLVFFGFIIILMVGLGANIQEAFK